jgi:hypothetical protein
MRLPLTRSESIELTVIITHLTLLHLCLLLLVCLGGYIVNLCDFYSYRLIGKLTAFLQLQEFILRILPVDSFTSAARRSPRSLNQGSATSLQRLQLYELILTLIYEFILTLMGRLSLQGHILTHHTRKLLVY